jgi:hypothetical protein
MQLSEPCGLFVFVAKLEEHAVVGFMLTSTSAGKNHIPKLKVSLEGPFFGFRGGSGQALVLRIETTFKVFWSRSA